MLKHESQKCKSLNNSAQNKNVLGKEKIKNFKIVAIFGMKIADGGLFKYDVTQIRLIFYPILL